MIVINNEKAIGKIRFGKRSGGQLTFVRVNKGKQ
jgi:hypothetical protein